MRLEDEFMDRLVEMGQLVSTMSMTKPAKSAVAPILSAVRRHVGYACRAFELDDEGQLTDEKLGHICDLMSATNADLLKALPAVSMIQ